jgi:hypothetical protein
MIISQEIQEYSSSGYLTPFALFKIKRDDSKSEDTMEYILDLGSFVLQAGRPGWEKTWFSPIL